MSELAQVAKQLVVEGKGILAADESLPTIEKRFKTIGIESTEGNRSTYRKMLFTTPGIEDFISGVIMFDESIRQTMSEDSSFAKILEQKGILPGIKVDQGLEDFGAGLPVGRQGEKVTKGLLGLGQRLVEYKRLGAKFTKWRMVVTIGNGLPAGRQDLPTDAAIAENAKRIAEYAMWTQKAELVPIVEPEVLMDGGHSLALCKEVTRKTLKAVFFALEKRGIVWEGMLLKPNMIVPGKESGERAGPETVAEATISVMKEVVPLGVPGIVFLSGGQSPEEATANLNAINKTGVQGWRLTFSFARALQGPALEIWKGKEENVGEAQKAFYKRAKLSALASMGRYESRMEDKGGSPAFSLDLQTTSGQSPPAAGSDFRPATGGSHVNLARNAGSPPSSQVRYKITAFGAARMDVFAKLPDDEVEAECGIDRKRCVIELGYGEKIPLRGIEYWVGGNAANLAVGMQRLGVSAMLVAELGTGLPADLSRQQLAAEGIGMEKVTQSEGVVAGLGIVINYQAERTILSYYPPFRPQFPETLVPTEWAYLTSMGEGFEEYYSRALTWVRTNKAKLGFNPGGRQIKKGREWLTPYLRETEVLLVNREEAATLLTQGMSNDQYSIVNIKSLLEGLRELGPKIVVVTDGPDGAYVCNGQTCVHMPIVDAPVVERTGAGDAFSTGLLAAIILGHDIEMALKWGTVNSASVIGKTGAEQGLLRANEIDAWVKKMEGVKATEI